MISDIFFKLPWFPHIMNQDSGLRTARKLASWPSTWLPILRGPTRWRRSGQIRCQRRGMGCGTEDLAMKNGGKSRVSHEQMGDCPDLAIEDGATSGLNHQQWWERMRNIGTCIPNHERMMGLWNGIKSPNLSGLKDILHKIFFHAETWGWVWPKIRQSNMVKMWLVWSFSRSHNFRISHCVICATNLSKSHN